jgi:DNA-binding transcriptional LysR family regulator
VLDLDLRLVRYFVAVANARHFGRAATSLFISQPALSQSIAKLEKQMGVRLLERSSRAVDLTPVGQAFLAASERLLQAANAAISVAERGRRAQTQTLRVGYVAGPGELMTQVLAEAEKRLPRITLETSRLEWRDQERAVVQGRVDVSFARAPITDPALECLETDREERVVVLAKDHLLADRETIDIDELSGERLITSGTCPSEEWRLWWAASPRPNGLPIRWGPNADTIEEMLDEVARGHGICITAQAVHHFYNRPDISFVSLTGVPDTTVQLCILSDGASPLARQFVDLAREVSADHRAGAAALVKRPPITND